MALEIPVIDVNRFEGESWQALIDEACEAWGCFQILNHGMDSSLIDASLEQMRAFFELPHETKLAIERTADNAWGFFDRELTKNVRDWKEIFDFGPPAASGPMAGSTPQWPAVLTDFRPVMERFYDASQIVAERLLAGISSNLGMASDYLSAGFGEDQSSFLRLNYYPVCQQPEAHLGISHHTDAGALTVLLQDDQPGLQFQHDGEWHTLYPHPQALIVNIGDIVQVWSNDRYRAPLHRVLTDAEQQRFSAPFFFNPSYDTDYAPLAGTVTERTPARYRSINWGEFRAGRAAGDYANYGEEIQISRFRI